MYSKMCGNIRAARRAMWLLGIIALVVTSTGCWDRVEIEERGFVIGAAIDLVESKEGEGDKPDAAQAKPVYKLTNQIVIPEMLQKGGSQGGKEGEAYLNVSAIGSTFSGITRQMATSVSRTPFTEHLKLIVISEQIARAGLIGPVLDVYIRDHEMRRSTRVLVSDGPAADVLSILSKNEWLPVLFVKSVEENTHKSGSLVSGVRIGEVQEHMMERYSFVLPKVNVQSTKTELSGAALFQGGNNRMVGWLDAVGTEALNFLNGNLSGAIVEFELDGEMCSFEVKRARRTIQGKLEDPERPKFTIDVFVSGNLAELHTGAELLADKNQFEHIEQIITEKMTERVKRIIDELQNNFYTDVLGLGQYVQQKHHRIWEKVRGRWDGKNGLFAASDIDVRVQIEVRSIGTVIKTQQ